LPSDMAQDESPEPLVLPRLEEGEIVLREFRDTDLELIREASRDPFIPLITSVPADYSEAEGLAFIKRQQGRLTSREEYAFVIANRADDRRRGHHVRLGTNTHLVPNRVVSLGVVGCRPVFERAGLNWRNTNPAYSPPSAHHPVPNTKLEFSRAPRKSVSRGYQYPFSTQPPRV